MDFYTNALSFLLVLVLFFSPQIKARESKFFTKVVVHYNTNSSTTNNATVSSHVHHVEPPSPSPSPSEAPEPVQSENGYGLYGHDKSSTKFPDFTNVATTSAATFENKESEVPTEEFKDKEVNYNGYPSNYNEHAYVTVPQGYNGNAKFMSKGDNFYDPKFSPSTTTNTNSNEENQISAENLFTEFDHNEKNNGYSNNYNHNSYGKEPQGMSDTRLEANRNYFSAPKFSSNTNHFSNEENENRYDEFNPNGNNNRNVYATEQQGLSDTRFVENGKYYYTPESDRNSGTVKWSGGDKNEGYYGNNERSKYEFDTMEEYERQEGYPQIEGEYNP